MDLSVFGFVFFFVCFGSVKSAGWRCYQHELAYCCPTVDEQPHIQGLISLLLDLCCLLWR